MIKVTNTKLVWTDIRILACPLTPGTTNLMGAKQFKALPKGAVILNIARGGVVDHTALMAALNSGHLSGAILDVFEKNLCQLKLIFGIYQI